MNRDSTADESIKSGTPTVAGCAAWTSNAIHSRPVRSSLHFMYALQRPAKGDVDHALIFLFAASLVYTTAFK
jgi:hypothetical protein